MEYLYTRGLPPQSVCWSADGLSPLRLGNLLLLLRISEILGGFRTALNVGLSFGPASGNTKGASWANIKIAQCELLQSPAPNCSALQQCAA